MKKLGFTFLILSLVLVSFAQDKKAMKGTFGIGFGVSAMPLQQNVFLSYMLSDKMELGTTLFITETHTRTSTYDSVTPVVFPSVTPFTSAAQHEARTETDLVAFGITPFLRYHFKTKNNLDVYSGLVIPIGINMPTSISKTSNIWTADNYSSTTIVTTKAPLNVTVGGGILLGCRWFFYENLAFGIETNLGVLANLQDGNSTYNFHVDNSGTNNTGTTMTIKDTDSASESKTDNINFSFLRNLGGSLTWYFGGKKKD